MKNSDKIQTVHFCNSPSTRPYSIVENDTLINTPQLFIPTLRDFHVVFWLKNGKATFYVDFKKFEIEENSILLLSKNQIHYFEKFNSNEIELQAITFSPEFIYRNDSDLNHLFTFDVSNHLSEMQVISLNENDINFLGLLSNNMTDVYNNWDVTLSDDAFYHFLCIFLIHLKSKTPKKQKVQLNENIKNIQQFNSLLEEKFKTEYKVEYYSQKLKLSTKSFSRLINKHYHISPKAIINERRILEIKRRLRATTESSKFIAYDLGFEEATNMVKYFKKHTGSTPLAFRDNSTSFA